jgi:hypothetical protein
VEVGVLEVVVVERERENSEDKQKNHHLLTRASKLCFLHKAPLL